MSTYNKVNLIISLETDGNFQLFFLFWTLPFFIIYLLFINSLITIQIITFSLVTERKNFRSNKIHVNFLRSTCRIFYLNAIQIQILSPSNVLVFIYFSDHRPVQWRDSAVWGALHGLQVSVPDQRLLIPRPDHLRDQQGGLSPRHQVLRAL